jgi:HSP20 family molecular chaperone IbpA
MSEQNQQKEENISTISRDSREKSSTQSQSVSSEKDKSSIQLPVDVYESPDAFFVVTKVSGVELADVHIEVLLDTINLSYKCQSPKIEAEILASEVQWGTMTRSIVMPDEIDVLGAEAKIENGVLTIIAPKLIKSTRKVLRLA